MGGRNRGGQKRGRIQRRHFRDGRQDPWKKPRSSPPLDNADAQQPPPREAGWDPFVTESPAFEQYYKKQQIVTEQEWDDFIATLRRPLPAVFRVNSSEQGLEVKLFAGRNMWYLVNEGEEFSKAHQEVCCGRQKRI